jgi:hypothetical protein
MDITNNKHAGPSSAIASKQPAPLSEAADKLQSIAWLKPEGQSSPSIMAAQESQPLILQQQQQRNQSKFQPLQKSQENEQSQQTGPHQPNNKNTRIGSVSRTISINKVRQSTSELETLLTDMKALRKMPNARSKPVLATSIVSRVSELTMVEPVREPSTARISYVSMASIESAVGVNAPMSEPPRFLLPVRPLASKRQSQTSQELQFQQQEAELYDLDRFSDAIDVATTKNDALSKEAPASSPLPATPVRKNFSFPHQHQRNQSSSSATSVHTLGDAISAIVNNKSNSTIVNNNRNRANPDDPALNLVLPPLQRSAISVLERQITGSSVDSSNEGYYTPAEENSTAANTPTTVTHSVDYNTFTPGSVARDNSMASPLFSIPRTRLGENFNNPATNAATTKATGVMSSGGTYGQTTFAMPTLATPVMLSRRAQTFPLTLSPSTVIANREYDKLQREKRKASAATVVMPAMLAGSASTTASAMAFNMRPVSAMESDSIHSNHQRTVSSPLLSQMPLPAPSIASEDAISVATEGAPATPFAYDSTPTNNSHHSNELSIVPLQSQGQAKSKNYAGSDNGYLDTSNNYGNGSHLEVSKWTAVMSSSQSSPNSKRSSVNPYLIETNSDKTASRAARRSYPEHHALPRKPDRPLSKRTHRHEHHHDSHRRSHRGSRHESSSATTVRSSSNRSCKKIPFTNEGIQKLLQDPTVPEMPQHHCYRKSSGGKNAASAATNNNGDNAEAVELPPTERVLIDKFVTALARLSTEMTDDEHKRPEGLRRLHNALKAIEGWI